MTYREQVTRLLERYLQTLSTDLKNLRDEAVQKIENCPFCNSTEIAHGEIVLHRMECQNCSAKGPIMQTQKAAKEAWNDRHPNDNN